MLIDEKIAENILSAEKNVKKTKGLWFLIKHASDDILEKTLVVGDLEAVFKMVNFPDQYGIQGFTSRHYALLVNTPSF